MHPPMDARNFLASMQCRCGLGPCGYMNKKVSTCFYFVWSRLSEPVVSRLVTLLCSASRAELPVVSLISLMRGWLSEY